MTQTVWEKIAENLDFVKSSNFISGSRETAVTAQKMKFSITDFFRKCDQICRKLRIWSHWLKKSVMENFIFCAVSSRVLWCKFTGKHPRRSAIIVKLEDLLK